MKRKSFLMTGLTETTHYIEIIDKSGSESELWHININLN